MTDLPPEAVEAVAKEWRITARYTTGRRFEEVFASALEAGECAAMLRQSTVTHDVQVSVRDVSSWRAAVTARCQFCGLYLVDREDSEAAHLEEQHPDVVAHRKANALMR